MSRIHLALFATMFGLPFPSSASAQQEIAYDTLSDMSSARVQCGFCSGERFGTIFKDLGEGQGLPSSSFPLSLRTISLALAKTTYLDSVCTPSADAETVLVSLNVYAGEEAPTDLTDMPTDGEWPGESLIYTNEEVALTSSPIADGSEVNTMFQPFIPTGEDDTVIHVEAPATYIRVVVGLLDGDEGSNDACGGPAAGPSAAPIIDADGRIADHTGFILAGGVSSHWFWNEDVPGGGISGDWALRISIVPSGSSDTDAGVVDSGTPAEEDSGPIAPIDAGTEPVDGGGDSGGCSVGVQRGATPTHFVLTLFALFFVARRRRS